MNARNCIIVCVIEINGLQKDTAPKVSVTIYIIWILLFGREKVKRDGLSLPAGQS